MVKTRWLIVGFVLGFLCATVIVGAAEPCVRIKTRPSVMIIKQDIDVQVRVCQQEDHRLLRIEWTSDAAGAGGFERSLAGAEAPVLHTMWLRDQSPGNYRFAALVKNGLGKIVASDTTTILGRPFDDGP